MIAIFTGSDYTIEGATQIADTACNRWLSEHPATVNHISTTCSTTPHSNGAWYVYILTIEVTEIINNNNSRRVIPPVQETRRKGYYV